jgi:peptidoglycan/xylan/chitin deacetylase (PgdA/CDA1 family)
MSTLLRLATRWMSPAGPDARLSIFIFHRVLASPDPLLPYEPDAAMFDRVLGWIGSQFKVLPLTEAAAKLFSGSLPSGAAAITFDDGYRDNFEVALPILQKHSMSATFFVATGYLDGGVMFNDRVIAAVRAVDRSLDCGALGLGQLRLESPQDRIRAIETILSHVKRLPISERDDTVDELARQSRMPSDLASIMMEAAQIRALASQGQEIGGHTRLHPILASIPDSVALDEIRRGRDELTSIVGYPPLAFAYPNGAPGRDFLPQHSRMVADAGFSLAVTTAPGAARASCDPTLLPRFTPWDRTRTRFGVRALRNIRRDVSVHPRASLGNGR